jgi:hypothetical protein
MKVKWTSEGSEFLEASFDDWFELMYYEYSEGVFEESVYGSQSMLMSVGLGPVKEAVGVWHPNLAYVNPQNLVEQANCWVRKK